MASKVFGAGRNGTTSGSVITERWRSTAVPGLACVYH